MKTSRSSRWSAIYDAPSGMGAVARVLDAPSDDDWRTRYWDVPDRHRKHYLMTFQNRTVPAEREFPYRVATLLILCPYPLFPYSYPGDATHRARSCSSAAVAIS